MKKIFSSFFALVLLSSISAKAQDNDDFDHALITDRPDTAEASQVVGLGRLQVETSFALSHDSAAGVTTRDYNFPTLLRYGLIEPLEVRVEGNMIQIETQTGTSTQTGFTDLAFGAKAHLQDGGGWAPSLGLLAHLTVPTGKNSFSSNALEPEFKVLMDWELPLEFSLGTNAGFDVPVQDASGDKFMRFLYAVALGHGIPGVGDRLRAFVELAGAFPTMQGKNGEHTFDAGFALLVTPNIQVDSFVQIGLTSATTDLATGLGLSFRL